MNAITFHPLFMERVWGGRRIADELGKPLPPGAVIGESWELVDREGEQSVVRDGEFAGLTLHELWTKHREEVFGEVADSPRFPLLAKILDAKETLSVQVHPPAHLAAELGGEPKTEMWYVLGDAPDAALYAGFRRGVTREDFDEALVEGTAAELLHRIPVREGDSIFIPSGRCHAIGGGCLMVEIQQNSDTTYRVFDWNRMGLDGKPRQLHVQESLLSIDFEDHEPGLQAVAGETVVECDYFRVEEWHISVPRQTAGCVIFTVLEGEVTCCGEVFQRGEFFLVPASAEDRFVEPRVGTAKLLKTTLA